MHALSQKQKIAYIQKEIDQFKKGLPLFFGFNLFLLTILAIIIAWIFLPLFFSDAQQDENLIYIALNFVIITGGMFAIIASGSFNKALALITFFYNKNDFHLTQDEGEIALEILEKSPLVLSKYLNTIEFEKRKKVINLLQFCDFIKIKNNKIYQTGLLMID